jgi:hypothetical protein
LIFEFREQIEVIAIVFNHVAVFFLRNKRRLKDRHIHSDKLTVMGYIYVCRLSLQIGGNELLWIINNKNITEQ